MPCGTTGPFPLPVPRENYEIASVAARWIVERSPIAEEGVSV